MQAENCIVIIITITINIITIITNIISANVRLRKIVHLTFVYQILISVLAMMVPAPASTEQHASTIGGRLYVYVQLVGVAIYVNMVRQNRNRIF